MPEQIAVIGSGAIACGLAAVATKTGDVTLLARSEESAERARASIEKQVGRMGDEAGPGTVTVTTDVADTASATVFVEAVAEDAAIKGEVFAAIASVSSDDALWATTTSSLSVGELARASGSPERFSDYVDDAAELAAAIGEPAFWVGHSLGGAVSYALATRTPVRGVVGIGAVYRFAQHNRVVNWLTRASHLARARGLFGGVSVRTRFAGQLLGRLYSISDIAGYAFPVSGWAPGSLEPELLAERLERGFDWTSLHVWLDMSRWAHEGGFDYAQAWAAADVPLLVITGDLDHLMPPPDARAAFTESGSRDKQLLELEPWNTGAHWGHLDLVSGKAAPEHVWAPVRRWIGER